MTIRNLIIAWASENKCSVDEAADALHSALDAEVTAYKRESEVYGAACDAVIADTPAISKEALPGAVAFRLAQGNPASFASTLAKVTEYVGLTYTGKRGRRAAGDESVRLTKRT